VKEEIDCLTHFVIQRLDAYMRIVLLLSFVLTPFVAAAQPPAAAGPQRPARSATASRTALLVTATDPSGATLPGIQVDVLGASDRSGVTDESGTLRLANMRAGTYRVRFSGDAVIPFEREITIRAGQTADLDVTLHPAPQREAEPEPAATAGEEPPAAPVGPPGEPVIIDIPDFADRNLIRREPRRDSALGCSGNARATLVQLNEPQSERLYETAESIYYVVAGEGTLRISGRETPITAGSFAMIPRGTAFAISRRGRNPIVLLSILTGEPCPAQTP
jgi:mannose-6-phosphate isomerase-like protein (cupin superfamily)